MADKLLVRIYDVGLGDCIYCRIPEAHADGGDFHLLIDCGSWSGMAGLEAALNDLKTLLPDAAGGGKRLDLLCVTHEHKDHIAGFDPSLWKDVQVGAIWMNAAMDPGHPQAGKRAALHDFATRAMRDVLRLDLALSPELAELAGLYTVDNDQAMNTLRKVLPEQSRIEPTYVHADSAEGDVRLPLKGAAIHVLGPERDIDFYYLGKDGDPSLHGLMGALKVAVTPDAAVAPAGAALAAAPGNISASDFRQLRSRMLSSAFAFADLDGKVTNNTSVVLLIEWRGKRLLFVGDAEWNARFAENKANGAWNVMWKKRRDKLAGPLTFLKIGHHGSENATPWNDREDGRKTEPSEILDAILPVDGADDARAVVSTERGRYRTIPRAALLAELGKRVSTTRNYEKDLGDAGIALTDVPKFGEFEKLWFGRPQPLRTDVERLLREAGHIDIEIEP